ncbi:MAG: nucleotidyltransferase family protein [Dyella sp.]
MNSPAAASDPRPPIVLLAAGAASRFGTPKQLAPIAGVPMLRRIALSALATEHPLLVIGGAHADAVADALAELPLHWRVHADWAQGLGSSIAFAIEHVQQLHPQASAALLCLGDQPLVETALLARLLAQHAAQLEQIVVADYGPRLGPPVLFPQRDFAALRELHGDRGAQVLLAAQPTRLVRIEAPQAAFDIDSPQDYQRLLGHLANPTSPP